MTLTRHIALFALAALMALALSIAACGGDDDDSSGDNDEPTSTEAAGDDSSDDGDDDSGDDDEEATPDATEDSGDDDDDGDDDGDSGDTDLCDLISVEEAGDALGLAVSDGVNSDDSDEIFGCDWEAESVTEVGVLYLEMRTGSDDDRQAYYDLLDEVEAVPDLGEEAKWNDGLSLLEVMGDDHYLSVQLLNFGLEDPEVRQRSIDFAALVLGKLE